MPVTFSIQTISPHSREALFDLSLDIDAHLAAFAGSREKAIAGVTSGQIGLGESVTWRARHFGFWFVLTTRITALERPERFVDEQVTGPFRVYVHEHRFHHEGSRVIMTDIVTVGSPVLGPLVDRLILRPYLRRMIMERNTHLLRALDAQQAGPDSR